MSGHEWVEQDYYSFTVKSPRFRCKNCGASSGVTNDLPDSSVKVIMDFYGLVISSSIERFNNGDSVRAFTCEEVVVNFVMNN